jgi:hypothetical protein
MAERRPTGCRHGRATRVVRGPAALVPALAEAGPRGSGRSAPELAAVPVERPQASPHQTATQPVGRR